jgi:hypothetical protein
VLKKLTVWAMGDNLGRLLMGHAAMRQRRGVERISLLDALRWLGAPSTGIPLGALSVRPVRPPRVAPRVKTRRLNSVPCMITPRQALRRQLGEQPPGGELHAIRPRAHIIYTDGE